jgi:hypothetical protein
MSVLDVTCFKVEVPETGRSLVQRSPNDRVVSVVTETSS